MYMADLRRLFLFLLRTLSGMLALLLVSVQTQAADRFVSVIGDLPLMPALVETPRSAIVFDKPEGRIVEVSASGEVAREAVLAYYRRALPQLGWRRNAGDGWLREGERLQIGFRSSAGKLIVNFSLAPR